MLKTRKHHKIKKKFIKKNIKIAEIKFNINKR